MAFLLAGTVHILYRLLFTEIDAFLMQLEGLEWSARYRSPAAGGVLLLLMLVLYRWVLSDPLQRGNYLLTFNGHPAWKALPLSALAGLISGGLVLLIAPFWPPGADGWSAPPEATPPGAREFPSMFEILSLVLFTPLVEEAYYRFLMQGYLQRQLQDAGQGQVRAVAFSLGFSVLCFAFSHHYFIAPVLLIPGLASGLIFVRWNALASLVTHSIYNSVLIGGTYVLY